MIDHVKMMKIPCLGIWSMLLSGQVPHRSNSSHLIWNLKNPLLVQALSYGRKITYHLLYYFPDHIPPDITFHKLISMQDFGHNMLHLDK